MTEEAAFDRGSARAVSRSRLRSVSIGFLSLFFCLAGANHFFRPAFYRLLIPPSFPKPDLLVAVSGVCEIAGGIGLLLPRWRTPAGVGLIVLLLAVLPVHIDMARGVIRIPGWENALLLWLRIPLQFVLMAWIGWSAKKGPPSIEEARRA